MQFAIPPVKKLNNISYLSYNSVELVSIAWLRLLTNTILNGKCAGFRSVFEGQEARRPTRHRPVPTLSLTAESDLHALKCDTCVRVRGSRAYTALCRKYTGRL